MGFFDEEDMENIFGQLMGGRPQKSSHGNFIDSEKEERIIDFIEEGDNIYFVFELFGYLKKDIDIKVSKNFIEVRAIKNSFENVADYLKNKLAGGVHIRKELPSFVKSKNFEQTFNNGILEVKFKRK